VRAWGSRTVAAQASSPQAHKPAGPQARRTAFYLGATTYCVLLLSACSPTYVLRAGYEEAKILWRREPIERLLQRSDLDAPTRAKLELALAVRVFARDTLHLRVDHSYATFARVDADAMVHVVTAAYRLRLEPYTWWFPIVGRVPYKGFFSQSAAEGEAADLERQGYDTAVRPSVAFSTLGWFADPLVSTLLRYDRAVLAEIIIHELLHNTSYLAGRADFDESFANFVGSRGAIMFFAARADAGAERQASAVWSDTLQFSDFLGRFGERLRTAYAAGVTLDERARLFTDGQDEFRRLPLQTLMYRDFGAQPLNNAVILQHLTYADRLQLFERLFEQQSGDLQRTIEIVLQIVHERADDPFAAVESHLQSPAAVVAGLSSQECSRGS
jgi:predicted aminopeptidase